MKSGGGKTTEALMTLCTLTFHNTVDISISINTSHNIRHSWLSKSAFKAMPRQCYILTLIDLQQRHDHQAFANCVILMHKEKAALSNPAWISASIFNKHNSLLMSDHDLKYNVKLLGIKILRLRARSDDEEQNCIIWP